jgi:hypothetical protein
MANGKKIYFKNMLTDPDGDYVELSGDAFSKEDVIAYQ